MEKIYKRVREGGFLICLDMPEGCRIGLGLRSHLVGPRFCGYKGIPRDGVAHLLRVARDDDGAGVVGVFLRWDADDERPVRCLRWDPVAEVVVPTAGASEWEWKAVNMELDGSLAMFSEEWESEWEPLSRHISNRVLQIIGTPVETLLAADETYMESLRDGDSRAPHTCVCPHFTKFDRPRRPNRMVTPSELSKYHMDKTEILNDILRMGYAGDWSDLLGEIQAAFLLFLFIYSLSALEHWKIAVHLLCNCDDAVAANPKHFESFLEILSAQLDLAPTDLFTDDLSCENFLRPSILSISEIIDEGKDEDVVTMGEINSMGSLRRKHATLCTQVEAKFGWTIPSQANLYSFDQDDEGNPVFHIYNAVPEAPTAEARVALNSAHSINGFPEFNYRRDELQRALDDASARPSSN